MYNFFFCNKHDLVQILKNSRYETAIIFRTIIAASQNFNSKFYFQSTNDDEIDIFNGANTKELQQTRRSRTEEENLQATPTSSDQAAVSLADELAESALKEEQSRREASYRNNKVIDIEVHASENGMPNWVKFEDIEQDKSKLTTNRSNLQQAYSSNSNLDLDRIDSFEDSFVHVPKPLFTETHINNNNTYSFDGGESVTSDEPVVFVPSHNKQPGFCDKHLYFFKQPTFYKSLLQIITTKYSFFMFYALFPSYMYMRLENLRIQQACFIVGHINLAHLAFGALNFLIQNSNRRKALFLWIFSWNGALGFIRKLFSVYYIQWSHKEVYVIENVEIFLFADAGI